MDKLLLKHQMQLYDLIYFRQFLSWKVAGATQLEILDHLHLKCVPTGYVPNLWIPGIFVTMATLCSSPICMDHVKLHFAWLSLIKHLYFYLSSGKSDVVRM